MKDSPFRYMRLVWRLSRRAIQYRLIFLSGYPRVSYRTVVHAGELEYLLGRMINDATTTLIW